MQEIRPLAPLLTLVGSILGCLRQCQGFLYFFYFFLLQGMLLNDVLSSLILRSVRIFSFNRENPFFSVNPMGDFDVFFFLNKKIGEGHLLRSFSISDFGLFANIPF